jgi:hypothetical protein
MVHAVDLTSHLNCHEKRPRCEPAWHYEAQVLQYADSHGKRYRESHQELVL